MAVQRVIPEGAFPPVRSRNGSALRQRPMPAPRSETSVAEEIELLPNDYQRALFCRKHAEEYRRRWFAGRQREIAYVFGRADARDPRFTRMTQAELQMTGQWRWAHSADAQYLFTLESTFTGWAQMYLSFAEMEVLSRHAAPPP